LCPLVILEKGDLSVILIRNIFFYHFLQNFWMNLLPLPSCVCKAFLPRAFSFFSPELVLTLGFPTPSFFSYSFYKKVASLCDSSIIFFFCFNFVHLYVIMQAKASNLTFSFYHPPMFSFIHFFQPRLSVFLPRWTLGWKLIGHTNNNLCFSSLAGSFWDVFSNNFPDFLLVVALVLHIVVLDRNGLSIFSCFLNSGGLYYPPSVKTQKPQLSEAVPLPFAWGLRFTQIDRFRYLTSILFISSITFCVYLHRSRILFFPNFPLSTLKSSTFSPLFVKSTFHLAYSFTHTLSGCRKLHKTYPSHHMEVHFIPDFIL